MVLSSLGCLGCMSQIICKPLTMDIKERLKLKATVEGSITQTTTAVAVVAVVAVEQAATTVAIGIGQTVASAASVASAAYMLLCINCF